MPPADEGFILRQTRILCASYAYWTGRQLIPGLDMKDAELTQHLWMAPFAVVAHDTQADPIFNFGNACALRAFAMSWQQFTQLPSRLSAEPLARDERARLLERVAHRGFVDDYAGIRISGDGTRFMIRNATVWNLLDEQGQYCGQAAKFELPAATHE